MTETWTIARILTWTQQHFVKKGVESARLDAEVLLAAVLDVNRIYLYTHFDKPLTTEEREAYKASVKRRAAREPVSQILGKKEFYGVELRVTCDVLTPRPETEHLVDAVRDWVRDNAIEAPSIVDIGTGSGAIAIALAKEIPESLLVATDISVAALAIAKENIATHELTERVEILHGDLFAPLEGRDAFDVVVCNPPYIDPAIREQLDPEVKEYEPAEALFADDGGRAIIGRLCVEAPTHLRPKGLLAFEIGHDQRETALALLGDAGVWDEIKIGRDLQGHSRVVTAFLRS